MLKLDNVLFLDTESDKDTKEPECIQYLMGEREGIIENFDSESWTLIKEMWDSAEAVVMFNAPYDIGVLSVVYGELNGYRWLKDEKNKAANWDMAIFNNRYYVRKLGFHRNLIKPLNRIKSDKEKKAKRKGVKSTSIVDLLKLWSILIDDGRKGSIGLKNLIKTVLKVKPIPYSPENARSKAYRLQDVRRLRDLMQVFLERTQEIKGLENYTWEQWGFIKTPATFTKLSYEEAYPELKDFNKLNEAVNAMYEGLDSILEDAFNGGITLSFHRGKVENTGWVDISGAYAHAMEFLNTDSYLMYDVVEHEGANWDYKRTNCLVHVRANFILKTVNKSLKLFALEEPAKSWVWYDDLIACKNLYPDFEYSVVSGFEFVPSLDVKQSLVATWIQEKDKEKKENGSSTYYDFCKFRSNTAYGIKAQRKPFKTIHTNMVIAGMITSTVHRVLTSIFKVVRRQGYKPKYCDTDSCCFHHGVEFNQEHMDVLLAHINNEIHPYRVESEGFQKETTFLSLKRYVSEGGTDKDKVKLHGKGRYNVKQKEIYDYVVKEKLPTKRLQVTQLAANTEISMKQILNVYPQLERWKHPFMFVTDVPVNNKTMEGFFVDWYAHIDTKTTFKVSGSFEREFHEFGDVLEAIDFFTNYKAGEDKGDDLNESFRNWDEEIKDDWT